MYKLVVLQPSVYEDFKNTNNHIYKSYVYNESLIKEKKYYLGLINENNQLLATTHLIEHNEKNYFKSYTSPYGYNLNYNDNKILKEFHKQIKKFLTQNKGISLTISPNIKDKNIINSLEKLKYKKGNKIIKNTNLLLDNNINNILKDIKKHHNNNYQILINDLTDVPKKYIDLHINLNKEYKSIIFTTRVLKDELIKNLNNELKKTINQISILPLDNLSDSAKEKLINLTNKKNNLNEELKKAQGNKDIEIININILIIYKDQVYIIPIISTDIINYNTIYEELSFIVKNNISKINFLNKPMNIENFKIEDEQYIGEFTYIPNKLLYKLFKKEKTHEIN